MTQTAIEGVVYPDSDGEPMADNTLQYEWIVLVRENLNALIPDFVAGNLLWYPVGGQPKVRAAPDVFVALGRPKGHRGSYKQWEEAGVAPQVVFEVLSPGNTASEMARKHAFYQRHGVEEYYVIDPAEPFVTGYLRQGLALGIIEDLHGFSSPRLRIGFELGGGEIRLLFPDGTPFRSFEEVRQALDEATARADEATARADEATARADALAAEVERLKRQLDGESR